jgi:hypothetical protein
MSTLFFWVVAQCGLAGRYQRLRETFSFHFQGCWKQYFPPKLLYLPTSPHDVTTQKTTWPTGHVVHMGYHEMYTESSFGRQRRGSNIGLEFQA